MESTRGYEQNIPNLSPNYGYINQTVMLEQSSPETNESLALESLGRNQQSVHRYEVAHTLSNNIFEWFTYAMRLLGCINVIFFVSFLFSSCNSCQ